MLSNKLYKSKKTVQQSIHSSLSLCDLELDVCLGWSQEERSKVQRIQLSLQIDFQSPPLGCKTDELTETYCYDALIRALQTHLASNAFRLIEHLAQTIYEFIKKKIDQPVKLTIRVAKTPSIPNLKGGVQFCYGDSAWSS